MIGTLASFAAAPAPPNSAVTAASAPPSASSYRTIPATRAYSPAACSGVRFAAASLTSVTRRWSVGWRMSTAVSAQSGSLPSRPSVRPLASAIRSGQLRSSSCRGSPWISPCNSAAPKTASVRLVPRSRFTNDIAWVPARMPRLNTSSEVPKESAALPRSQLGPSQKQVLQAPERPAGPVDEEAGGQALEVRQLDGGDRAEEVAAAVPDRIAPVVGRWHCCGPEQRLAPSGATGLASVGEARPPRPPSDRAGAAAALAEPVAPDRGKARPDPATRATRRSPTSTPTRCGGAW